VSRILLLSIVSALAALSLPGVRAARAQADLLPPAAELFNYRGEARPAGSGPASCPAASEAPEAAARRQAALEQIRQVLQGAPGDEAQPLDGRGYGYHAPRDPYRELRMVEMEAQRERMLRAAEQR